MPERLVDIEKQGSKVLHTKRSINASANAPTRCRSGNAILKARRTSTGFGHAPLRRADASPEHRKYIGTITPPLCWIAVRPGPTDQAEQASDPKASALYLYP